MDRQTCPSLPLYGIRMAGISDTAAPFCFIRRRPQRAQVLVCLSGWGMVLSGGTWVHCGPGMAYLTPPEVTHGYKSAEGTRWRFGWVMYDDHRPENTVVISQQPRLVTADVLPLADSILGLYREALRSAEPTVLYHWTSLIHRYAERVAEPAGSDRLLRILWELVDSSLSHPWNIAELAERAGFSGEHLRRLCHTELGCSPMRHVTALRMRRGAALLASGAFTIESVAEQVGYDNSFAFSTAFKRHTGLSPSEYRRQKPVF